MAKTKISVKDKIAGKMTTKHKKNVKNRGFISFLDTSSLENVEFFNPKKGKHCIDIVPYEVVTDGHPTTEQGEWDYNLELWVHYGVGSNNASYLCLDKMYGKKCPICEYLQMNDVEDEDFQQMKAKQRVVYNVLDSEDGKLKLFNISYPLFEDEWQKLKEDYVDEEEIVTPIYAEDGYSIRFTETGKKGLGRFSGFRFKEIEDYDESLLDKSISLETLMVIPTYEEVKSTFEGNYSNIEDEEGVEGEIEEEPKKEVAKKSKGECPSGLTFGEDFETDDACDECPVKIYKACKAENYSE